MIKSFLLQIRQKPKHVRQRFALIIAASFTGIVALVWMTFLPGRIGEIITTKESSQEAGAFSSFRENVSNQIDAMRSNKNETSDSVEERERPASLQEFIDQISSSTSQSDTQQATSTTVREVRIATTSSSTVISQ